MKVRDLIGLIGFRPDPIIYDFDVRSFELPKDGTVQYAQWLHPAETEKIIRQETVDQLRRFIKPGDVAIDIGAHSGDSTVPMALAAGSNGCVLALEPNRYVFPVLKKNATLNTGKTNIVPLMFAATSYAGEFEFDYSDAGFCNGGHHEGISKWRHGHAFKLKVRGENLTEYLSRNYPDLCSRITYIKVDTEGNDYAVLLSLEKLIAEQRPVIRCEIYKHLTLERRLALFSFLEAHGYTMEKINHAGSYMGEKLTKDNLMSWRHYYVICVFKNG